MPIPTANAESFQPQFQQQFSQQFPQAPQQQQVPTRIREIWTGNLAQTVTEAKLYTCFFIYGEIERLEMFMFKNFAFIRYKEVAAALRAHELAKGLRIDGRPVKVAFSDHTRRKDAIGDIPGYSLTELNAKALLMKYGDGPVIVPPEEVMKGMLSRYGTVKAVYILLNTQQDPGLRPQVYVDFYTHV